jgi:hypothetical protein
VVEHHEDDADTAQHVDTGKSELAGVVRFQ